MFSKFPLSLEENEAVALDQVFLDNPSIKKRAELISTLKEDNPDSTTYLILLIMSDYLDKEEQDLSAVDRLMNAINTETISAHALIIFIQCLNKTQHLYKNYKSFYKKSTVRLNSFDIDIEKVLKE